LAVVLNTPGLHNAQDALAALAIATALCVLPDAIPPAFAVLTRVAPRLHRHDLWAVAAGFPYDPALRHGLPPAQVPRHRAGAPPALVRLLPDFAAAFSGYRPACTPALAPLAISASLRPTVVVPSTQAAPRHALPSIVSYCYHPTRTALVDP
ncbi:hypothetical protein ACU7M0_37530, partial [Burkholderia cenocepacia]